MRRNRTWGDELTMRAAADTFNVRIHVITSEQENYLLHYDPEEAKKSSKPQRQLFLSYVSPIHYNTVAPLR